jgi:hypothetical protein
MNRYVLYCFLLLSIFVTGISAQVPSPSPLADPEASTSQKDMLNKPAPTALGKEKIPAGSKVFIATLNGYESFLVAAIMKKKTPVVVVNVREKADYEITGVSESVQAGWAKMLFFGSQQSAEQASIVMTNLKSGVVVWGYNVNKNNSYKGKQSSSEACAKHLKSRMEDN